MSDVISIGRKFKNKTVLFTIILKPKIIDNKEKLLRQYVDKAGFLCVCGDFVVAFINGYPQVFLLNDIEEITFQGKDSLGIGKSSATNQG